MIRYVSDRVRIARAHMGGGRIRDSKNDSPDLHHNLPNQHGQETKTGQAKVRWEGRVDRGTEVEGQAEGNGGGIRMDAGKQLLPLLITIVHPCCPCLLFIPASLLLCSLKFHICD